MKIRSKHYFILLPVLLIIIISLVPVHYLEASEFRSNSYLKGWKINKEDSFTVKFTHSVMLTPVYETYVINDDLDIVLSETVFYSYGAGLPETTIYDFEITEDGFRIYNINKKLEDLVYRTGAVIANHQLIIEDREIPFLGFSKPRQAVQFKVKLRPLIVFTSKEVIRWTTKIINP